MSFISLAPLLAQQPTKIKVIRSDFLKFDKRLGENVQRLIGNVILKHDSTLLYCDSAYTNEVSNSFEGYGNVKIRVSDTLNIYSRYLNYDGNQKLAELKNDVRVVDKQATLYTNYLWYDRQKKVAYYLYGGKIVDSTNTLTSIKGYYYTTPKDAFFKDSVKLVNDDYTIHTDTMIYNTVTELTDFQGPTRIVSEDNLIFAERGWYDTKRNESFFYQNASFIAKEQQLEADSLYFNRENNYGKAIGRVILTDTVQEMIVTGEFGEFFRSQGFSYVTDNAVAIMAEQNDSLFMHGDTLWIKFDSAQNPLSLHSYFKTKFYRQDIQGMCDSLVYNFADSTIFLFEDPVLWSDENQLTADTIRIAMVNKGIDSLALIGSAFIISMDDTIARNTFNQVRGKTMVGYFKDNEMVQVKIYGNAESVFYVREELGPLIGINKTSSSDMNIFLEKNEVIIISPIRNVDANMYPDAEFPTEQRKLKGFRWIEGQRPKSKRDIF